MLFGLKLKLTDPSASWPLVMKPVNAEVLVPATTATDVCVRLPRFSVPAPLKLIVEAPGRDPLAPISRVPRLTAVVPL